MSQILETAFSKASQLPRDEQDRLGRWLLDEMDSEKRWDELYAERPSVLADMAREARAEHQGGRSTELNPDDL